MILTSLRCYSYFKVATLADPGRSHNLYVFSREAVPPSVTRRVPLAYLVTVLLMPPHNPLSEVIGTVTFFSTSAPAPGSTVSQKLDFSEVLSIVQGSVLSEREVTQGPTEIHTHNRTDT